MGTVRGPGAPDRRAPQLRSFITSRVLGLAMAFGAGVLISAVAFDLVEEAFTTSDQSGTVGFGLLAGAWSSSWAMPPSIGWAAPTEALQRRPGGRLTVRHRARRRARRHPRVDRPRRDAVDRRGHQHRVRRGGVHLEPPRGAGRQHRARPGGLVTPAHRRAVVARRAGVGDRRRRSATCRLDGASPEITAFTLAFAGGAVLTMLADTMMPEAFEHGGGWSAS